MIGWLLACSAICLIFAHLTPEHRFAIRWLLGCGAWALMALVLSHLI